MTTILVTGSGGQLGRALQDLQPAYPQFQMVFLSRETLSITDEAAVREAFEKYKPAYLLNCAAYTAVDKAEEERDAAFAINGAAVALLAGIAGA